MSLQLTRISLAAGAAAFLALTVAAETVDARDWRRSVANHYEAAEAARFEPQGDNPRWDFTLNTVMYDMAWRQRTARMLRQAPKPGIDPDNVIDQLANRPKPPTLRFGF